ncbi:MAG: crossover junction endodeoxyribonuclease RuvC [Candidatus Carbobacillus altaicus]|uniref:Crossover junction endodeoxyribonuclease RuvC n=1 Tax=Candidatus Carbonibacillus altaicus TaxID=2163959 RepID=A0A2R6Y599_9BACL|nr:crossover junction endodeoxyribonuclease RuvC [Candidatus Carbobacillus altaicus]PTQ57838.1 MAG: Crossover junction endodeoxyribonuclease RuvC [Candidatus Carbobacillus altaicus]
MRIMGIDPGLAIVGFGLLEMRATRSARALLYGTITTPKEERHARRLVLIAEGMRELLEQHKPDAVALEKLFFNTNTTTGMSVSEARGVITLVIEQAGIPMFEYTPLAVKQAIVGYGRAEKIQVQEMTRRILSLARRPRPDDAADALAVALTHAQTYPFLRSTQTTG